jgi:hypothetical protein
MSTTQTYKNKAHAARAARKQGFENFTLEQIGERWIFVCEQQAETFQDESNMTVEVEAVADTEFSDAADLSDDLDFGTTEDLNDTGAIPATETVETEQLETEAQPVETTSVSDEETPSEEVPAIVTNEADALKEKALEQVNADDFDGAIYTLKSLVAVRQGKSRPPKTGGSSYKALKNASKPTSTVLKPVEFVFKFLNANPNLARKDALAALVDAGVNFSTAHTQYQRWRKQTHPKQEG